jgi:DNA-directed RNA polymerase specialized sigma24 family protein
MSRLRPGEFYVAEDEETRRTRRADGSVFTWYKDKAARRQQVFDLRMNDRLEPDEIALRLGISTRTVYRDLAACFARMHR